MKFKDYVNESTIRAAFFITPNGKILNVGINHIDAIIKNPKKFGFTKEAIESEYRTYKEKVGTEGKAREKILRKLMEDGWIRLRRYPNAFWSVQISKLTKRFKDYLYDWSKKVLKGISGFRETDKHMPVKIVPMKGGHTDVKMIPIGEIAKDALYNESEGMDDENVLIEMLIEDLPDTI